MQKMTMKHFALEVRSPENEFLSEFHNIFSDARPHEMGARKFTIMFFSLFRREVLKGELRNDQDSLVEERISENAPTRKSATDVNYFFIH